MPGVPQLPLVVDSSKAVEASILYLHIEHDDVVDIARPGQDAVGGFCDSLVSIKPTNINWF